MPIFSPPLPFARPLLPPLDRVLRSVEPSWKAGSVTKGPVVEAYEQAAAQQLGVPVAVAVSSCTTGLLLALRALKLDGDCLVPSFTFTATVQAVLWNGLKPVFVDCHPTRLTVDLESLAALATPATSAVLVPYVFGNPPPLDELEAFCRKRHFSLILDAAHALGSLYKGKPPGSRGLMEVFSTSATKLLCTGEGGLVASADSSFRPSLEALREYGHASGYEARWQGLNGRMTEFQGAMGLEALPLLEDHARRRNRLASAYRKALTGLPVRFQEIEPDARSSYKDFAIFLEEEWLLGPEALARELEKEGIPTRRYFPPLHRVPFFQKASPQAVTLPRTENVYARVLSLPMFYDLRDDQIEQIGLAFRTIFGNQRAIAGRAVS